MDVQVTQLELHFYVHTSDSHVHVFVGFLSRCGGYTTGSCSHKELHYSVQEFTACLQHIWAWLTFYWDACQ